MALLDPLHWKVTAGQTWNQIASAASVPVGALLLANDLADTPNNRTSSPRTGRVVHLPFLAVS
jgi:LysM repeat protein